MPYPYVFGVRDFNDVGADFFRCTLPPEIKMAAKKSEVRGKLTAHARKVYKDKYGISTESGPYCPWVVRCH